MSKRKYEVIDTRSGYRDIDKVFNSYEAAEKHINKLKKMGVDYTHMLSIDLVDANVKNRSSLKIKKA
tara:strand:+ start:46 stop:246 length:201 start_codon:yes stop_codon:yes gene_type:complete